MLVVRCAKEFSLAQIKKFPEKLYNVIYKRYQVQQEKQRVWVVSGDGLSAQKWSCSAL